VGPGRLAGYGLGTLLLLAGALILPLHWGVLLWTLPAGPLALLLLLAGGSFILPPPRPIHLFSPEDPAHNGCRHVHIPDGEHHIPGFLLFPRDPSPAQTAVCVVPGAGDTKSAFKWRMVEALLAEGLIVLTIDLPGHGEYRHRPMAFPDCLTTVPAAVAFLRHQPEVGRVGLAAISMGGAIALSGLARQRDFCIDALVILETPVTFTYSRNLALRELGAVLRAPILSLFAEISLRQIRQGWREGGYRSRHSTAELIELLNPLEQIPRLSPDLPLLLIYGERDTIAPPFMGRAMQRAAPRAELIIARQASHVTLTLMGSVNRLLARWLREKLAGPEK
jgi:pimeloyl-ACP methyl ester carboxylesterase